MAYSLASAARSLIISGALTGTLTVDAGSGANRLLVVILYQRSGTLRTVSALTYNGVALTQAGSEAQELSTATDLGVSIWYLANPAAGSNTLSLTINLAATVEAVATVWNGGLQTSPFDKTDDDVSASGTAPACTLTPSTDGCLIIGGVLHEDANALTVAHGTSIYDTDQGAWVTSSAYIIQTTAAAATIDWTAGAAANYAALAASFKPAATAPAATSSLLYYRNMPGGVI